jgi:hypothetical protein
MSAFSETDRRGYLCLEQGTLIEPSVRLCQRNHLSPDPDQSLTQFGRRPHWISVKPYNLKNAVDEQGHPD